jgi:hypothetical protein
MVLIPVFYLLWQTRRLAADRNIAETRPAGH